MGAPRAGSRGLTTWVALSVACTPPLSTPAGAMDAGRVDAVAPPDGRSQDGSPDMPPRSATATVSDGVATVSLTAGPVRLRVSHPDGTPWFASPAVTPWLEVGVATNGTARWHDPTVLDPPGIQWVTPGVVLDPGDGTGFTVTDTGEGTGRVTVSLVARAPGVFAVTVHTDGPDVALLRFHLATDAGGYHGLGERLGPVDARGSVVPMQLAVDPMSTSGTNEAHVPVPFMVSTRAYGMFVATRGAGAFDVAAGDPSRVSATVEATEAEVDLFTADTPLSVVAAYTRRTGLPRLPPRWTAGPMQWRNTWDSQDQMLSDAARLRADGIATTTLWIDNPWEATYNDHVFDSTRFPDPAGLFSALRRMGYRVLVWSTPYVQAVPTGGTPGNEAQRLYAQARDAGWLVRLPTGEPYVSVSNPGGEDGMAHANGGMLDFTSGDASAFWTARLAPLVDLGVRGFKLDYGEDIVASVAGIRPGFQFSNGSTERTEHALYPQQYHAAYQAAFQRVAGDGFLLVRASSWGGQSVADVVWPGDLDNDFRPHGLSMGRVQVGGLPAAVHAMISLSASGFPAFGSDTGGFRGGMPGREALLRWAEHTAYSPVMQLGGGGMSHNPWDYDPEATAIYRDLARQHQDLVPYLRVQALRAALDGTPVTRALALAFPDDPGSVTDGDSYLLGPDLLVAPVVTAGVNVRRVHVPPGTWVHWLDGTVQTGPADVDFLAPLGHPAVFVRQGAVIPLLPSDVVTLSPAEDPTVVTADTRRTVTLARGVPAGSTAVTLEDASRITVDESAGVIAVGFDPGRDVTELRAVLDTAHRGHPSAPVTAVTLADGTALTHAPDAATVAAGCDRCWYADPTGRLAITVRGSARVTAR